MTKSSLRTRISVSLILVIWTSVGPSSGSSRIWPPQGLLGLQRVPSSFKDQAVNWRRYQAHSNDNANPNSGPSAGYSVGLRRRQPALRWRPSYPLVSLDGPQYANGSYEFPLLDAVPSKRQAINNNNHNNYLDNSLAASQLAYLISPFSEQIIPIDRDNFLKSDSADGGYMNLIALTDGYKLGLRRYIDAGAGADQHQYRSDRGPAAAEELNDCQTIRSEIELAKDELDPASGRVLRTCRGLVQLNRCEGSCYSGIQPTIKSRTGFKKVCSCCNEGAFRRVQVRLNQCKSMPAFAGAGAAAEVEGDKDNVGRDTQGGGDNNNNNNEIVRLNSLLSADQQLRLLSGLIGPPKSTLADEDQDQRRVDSANQERKLEQTMGTPARQRQSITSGGATRPPPPPPLDYMDIEVDEPVECKCRKCDSAL